MPHCASACLDDRRMPDTIRAPCSVIRARRPRATRYFIARDLVAYIDAPTTRPTARERGLAAISMGGYGQRDREARRIFGALYIMPADWRRVRSPSIPDAIAALHRSARAKKGRHGVPGARLLAMSRPGLRSRPFRRSFSTCRSMPKASPTNRFQLWLRQLAAGVLTSSADRAAIRRSRLISATWTGRGRRGCRARGCSSRRREQSRDLRGDHPTARLPLPGPVLRSSAAPVVRLPPPPTSPKWRATRVRPIRAVIEVYPRARHGSIARRTERVWRQSSASMSGSTAGSGGGGRTTRPRGIILRDPRTVLVVASACRRGLARSRHAVTPGRARRRPADNDAGPGRWRIGPSP